MARLTIDWKPDHTRELPLYKQIVDYIKEKVVGGEWPVRSQIPAQRELAKAFGVNRSTVVTALEELKAERVLEAIGGSGTRVSNNTWSMLTSSTPPDWLSIVRLGTGELSPELIPSKMMRDVISRLPEQLDNLGYSEPKGLLRLREQISRHLKTRGIDASPASILIVSGALQALQLISVGILHRGATIFLEKPSYLSSLHIFQSTDMRLFGIPLDEAGIRPELITQHKRRQNGALLYTIPSFHNPTGTLMTAARRQQLLQVCEKEQLPIIEDDVYGELWLDEPGPQPLKVYDKNGLVLYLGSLSKTLSPGLRIG